LKNNISDYLKDFFAIYGDFITYDAYYSLSFEGRNRDVILHFYKCLSKIINPTLDEGDIQKAMDDLLLTFAKYIENKFDTIDIGVKDIHVDNYEKYNLSDSLKIFYDSAEQYAAYTSKLEKSDITRLYIKNVQDYYYKNFLKPIPSETSILTMMGTKFVPRDVSTLKQALMEFNNFLSHVYTALVSTEDVVIIGNLERAQGHLHRSALDFYKAIIKNLKFSNKLLPEKEQQFLQVRALEYKSIGHAHDNRVAVIGCYHDIVAK
jgi:hypothetical protein